MPHTDELELSLRAKSNGAPHLNRAAQALFFVNAAIWFLVETPFSDPEPRTLPQEAIHDASI